MTLSPSCRIYAVTGRPVLHSRGPNLFQPLLDATSGAHYLRLAARTAKEALAAAQHIGMRGLNVTAPFKEEMLRLANGTEPSAREIGAANVVLLGERETFAANTDHLGVVGALRAAGCAPAGKRAVVLGAGGAARAAVYGLLHAGASVTVVNRTFEKAQHLAERFSCSAAPLDRLSELLANADILVTTIPDPTAVLTAEHLHADLTVLDADYKGTALARLCEERGVRYVPGTAWLLHQATPSYELFTGEKPDEATLTRGLETPPLSADRPIALIGFMGSGKTTVGRELARLTGRAFIDTDDWVEQQSDMTIADLFVEKGEPFFREREKEALVAALDYPRAVISCGGGIVLDEENRRLLREKAIVVWLFVNAETTLARIAGSAPRRPLLEVPNAAEKAVRLFHERIPHYAAVTSLVIDTTALKSDETAALIAEELGNLK